MTLEIHVVPLFDAIRVETDPECQGDLGLVKHPQHPRVLQLAEGYSLVGRLTRDDESVIRRRRGEGQHALGGVAIGAHRHGPALERHSVLSTG